MKYLKTVLILSAAASLGACATNDMSMTSDTFGMAVRHNIAVQTVEPTPEQKQNTYIQPDAQRMANAQERYRKDEVEEPEDLSTLDD
ncbi:MAG: hypothetical protein HKN36_13700 [Hellea sp.]|nr:hypothetical protein [Hellea sp.]